MLDINKVAPAYNLVTQHLVHLQNTMIQCKVKCITLKFTLSKQSSGHAESKIETDKNVYC